MGGGGKLHEEFVGLAMDEELEGGTDCVVAGRDEVRGVVGAKDRGALREGTGWFLVAKGVEEGGEDVDV